MKQHFTRPLPVRPLNRISPSRFAQSGNCILRELWSADKETGHLLPSPPQSILGIIVHELIEQVVLGNINNLETLDEAWEKLIYLYENNYNQSWFENHLVPLKRNILGYEVQRHQCLNVVNEILRYRMGAGTSQRKSQKRRRGGVWLESGDHIVGGYLDEIYEDGSFAEIIDYKSGAVLDQDRKQLKVHYAVQLKLYAALYFDNFQRWPDKLTIKQLNGNEFDIPFTADECLMLFNQAKDQYHYINQLVANNGQNNLTQLAMPSSINCKFCSYRPACTAYQNDMEHISKEWVNVDLCGTIVEKESLKNGKLRIVIKTKDEFFYVRGISLRHPALEEDDLNKAFIFNLGRDITKNTYNENIFTTIYFKA